MSDDPDLHEAVEGDLDFTGEIGGAADLYQIIAEAKPKPMLHVASHTAEADLLDPCQHINGTFDMVRGARPTLRVVQ